MSQIKILIVAGHMDVGGIENQLMHLLRNADKSKFQIDFTTTVDTPYYKEEILSLGSRCIRLPETRRVHYLRYCWALYRVMKDGKYDIVHSHELFHSGMVLPLAKAAGIPHRIVHAHNWSDAAGPNAKTGVLRRLYNKVMQGEIRRCATQFVACSTLAGQFLYGDDITKQESYHLVFNSVDTGKFLDHYDNKESGEYCGDGWINVLQVGRFSAVKNQLFTVEIAKELRARGRNIRILCAGNNGNEYETRVVEAIEREGLQAHMRLLGVRSDIDVLMRKSSAFLLPSLYEGMPLVLIEAQAAGLRCVVADTFSQEVDFGIGSVRWMDFNAPAGVWADALEEAAAQGRAEREAVTEAVARGGFDSKTFSERICDIYASSITR